MYLDVALLAGVALLFSSIAGMVEKSWLTGPILFTLFGFAIGPLGLNLLSFSANAETIKILAELTLALVLFLDAAGADLKVLRRESSIPVRMLLIGLPLTLLASFGVGLMLFDELLLIEVAILATVLAPTDAALGQAVVKSPVIPAKLRQGLNAESGLNDGICVPILYLFLALAATSLGHVDSSHSSDGSGHFLGLQLFIKELGIGLLVGMSLVFIAYQLLRFAQKKQWLTEIWNQVPIIALSITCFATAQYCGGSGFIAAFCGGLLFAYLAGDQKHELLQYAEGTGELFALITWVLFGSVVLGHSINFITWTIVIYALLSLTVLRMLPIFLSLLGTDISFEGKLFLGWFGPRGLASIVFSVMVLNANLPHGNTILTTIMLTVVLSIVLHGISAAPWVKRWERLTQ